MGILDFLLKKRENLISQTSIENEVSSHQNGSQEAFKNKSLNEGNSSNNNQTPTIATPKHIKYTVIQISQIIDFMAKEAANYNSQLYEGNIKDIDMKHLDPLIETAAKLIVSHQQVSTSLIQREFSIGYNRAGRIMDQLEKIGIVGSMTNSSMRQVLCFNINDLKERFRNTNFQTCSFDPQKAISNMTINELNIFKNQYHSQITSQTEFYKNIKEQEEKDAIRSEIEAEKERIKKERLAKKRARDIKEAAMKELAEEGILDSDYIKKRESIPQDVQDAVWNRDGGRCVKCGSQENLEFDHIIPFSKGGSSSIRNLQLLCKKCNLEKSNKIG